MPVTRLLYPLYQLGNPQLRIFRPKWFLTLVRPGKEQPPDTVQFRIPMEYFLYLLIDINSGPQSSGQPLQNAYSGNTPKASSQSGFQFVAEMGVMHLLRMTKCDVKSYLEKIYNVPVGVVRTRIQFGSNKKRNHLNQRVKQPDYKVAYIQLAQGQTFTFPDIFPEKEQAPKEGSVEEMQEKFMEDEKQRQRLDPRRGGVTEWFGL